MKWILFFLLLAFSLQGNSIYAARKDLVTKWRHNPYSDTVAESSLNVKK